MSEAVRTAVKAPGIKKEIQVSQVQKDNFNQPASSPVEQILFLQKTIGNRAVQRLMKSGALQAKLRIGAPGDVYEQEADRMAKGVVASTATHDKCAFTGVPGHIDDKKNNLVQRSTKQVFDTNELFQDDVLKNLGHGKPLDPTTRNFMESRFGHEFSRVRIHEDNRTAESARQLNARAYTRGQDIVFAEGQYQPETHSGKLLLAHELSHVVQQQRSTEIKYVQAFQLPLPKFLGLPDIYIEPIPHTHPLEPCVSVPVTHIGVMGRQKGPLSTGKGRIIFNLHIGFYRDPTTQRACFVMLESHATGFCFIQCFPNWDDIKRLWTRIRDAIADALKYIFAAVGIAVAAWIIYLIADAIATALLALLGTLAVA